MAGLVERLRDKTRLRRRHGLSGWVLREEELTDEAADHIEALEADLHAVETALSRGSLQQPLGGGDWPMLAINAWNETSGARQRIAALEAENAELRKDRNRAEAELLAAADAWDSGFTSRALIVLRDAANGTRAEQAMRGREG